MRETREKDWLQIAAMGKAVAKAARQGGWKFRVLPPGLAGCLQLALALSSCLLSISLPPVAHLSFQILQSRGADC